jgi:hypothetical protein
MNGRFVVTGSGRCGTKWMSKALTSAGVPCGHESVFGFNPEVVWPDDLVADSSWMAATRLDEVDVPVLLMVRHPLAVVRSFVEIGFFAEWDAGNPCHAPLRRAFPWVYDGYHHVQDRALAMWLALTTAALGRAEMVVRLDRIDADLFGRVLWWAGADESADAATVLDEVPPCNRHEESRQRTGVAYESSVFSLDPVLAFRARELAAILGYQDEGD